MISWHNKKIKKMDTIDLGLIKWSTAAAILFIITIWPRAMNLIQSINPWYYLIAFIIFVIRPVYRIYIK